MIKRTSFLKVTKDEFIDRVLKPLNPRKIFVGEDYNFGVGGEGDAAYLSRFFDVEVVPLQKIDNMKISSKKIRQLVEAGEVEQASRLLGRPYRLITPMFSLKKASTWAMPIS